MDISSLIRFFKKASTESLLSQYRVKLLQAMEFAYADMCGLLKLNRETKEQENRYTKQQLTELRKFIDNCVEDKDNHYLSLSLKDPFFVSYSKYGDVNNKEDEKKRKRCRLFIYIEDYALGLKESVIRDFCEKTFANVGITFKEPELNILQAEDIMDFYDKCDDTIHSCTTGGNSNTMEMLTMNPGKVELITLGDRARALLWTCDDGAKVLDRCYPAGSKEIEILRSWAKSKGYILRQNPDQLIRDWQTVKLSDGSIRYVTLQFGDVFPYLDTFAYGKTDDKSNTIVLSNDAHFGTIMLHDTSGSFYQLHCKKCRERIIDDSKSYIDEKNEKICEECFYDYYSSCDNCREIKLSTELETQDDGQTLCKECARELQGRPCGYCNQLSIDLYPAMDQTRTPIYICHNCESSKFNACKLCKRLYPNESVSPDKVCKFCEIKNEKESGMAAA